MPPRPPAIAGVSSSKEAVIMTVYPSISCLGLGTWLGRLYESAPTKIFGIKLSYILYCLITAPGALKAYFYLKLFGETYVVTNRSIQRRKSLGNALVTQVPLASIATVTVRQTDGQQFYKAADLLLLNKAGETVMVLAGVPRADVFRQTIVEAIDAHNQVAASLATIRARTPVTA